MTILVISISVSVNCSGHVIQSVTTKEYKQRPVSKESTYWMPVRFVATNGAASAVPLADGVIEVKGPRDFLDGDFGDFALEWVDFYR